MSGLLSRVVVAAVGLPVVLGAVWLGHWWLLALLGVAGLIALHEFYVMARPLRPVVIAGFGGFAMILLGMQLGGLQWATAGVAGTLALAFLLKGLADTRQSATVAIGATALGAAWVGFGLGYIVLVRALPVHGRLAAFALLLSVFAGDSAAFGTGALIGRHKLAPSISPGKTWEGFVGGTAATVFTAWIALYHTSFLQGGRSLVLGLAIAVAGPIGDLFESMLKRDMDVKDTGKLLAGHGGVLDRVDSLLFASIAAYLVIAAFGEG